MSGLFFTRSQECSTRKHARQGVIFIARPGYVLYPFLSLVVSGSKPTMETSCPWISSFVRFGSSLTICSELADKKGPTRYVLTSTPAGSSVSLERLPLMTCSAVSCVFGSCQNIPLPKDVVVPRDTSTWIGYRRRSSLT